MITVVLTLVAFAFPVLEGTMALRLIEGKKPVLGDLERLCAGALLGWPLSGFVLFWLVLAGVPLTLVGFLGVHIVLVVGLGLTARAHDFVLLSGSWFGGHLTALWHSLIHNRSKWLKLLLAWMIIWTLVKILAGAYDLLHMPPYWDDVYANWHMRAKALYFNKSLLLDLPRDHSFYFGGRAASYPLTVYFAKVWLAQMTGGWKEPVLNSIHVLWFFSFLGVFFATARRHVGALWGTASVWVLVSLPLVLVQGSNAYTDVFMAAHVFIALSWFWEWVQSKSQTWLALFSFSLAAMVYTKNEALLIFLPPLALLLLWECVYKAEGIKTWFFAVLPAALVAVSWTLFKFSHALGFANNKDVSAALTLVPNAAVPSAIASDLLYTGSFFVLFPLFVLICVLSWKYLRSSALRILVLFLAIVFVGEFCIYWMTDLADEALRHTGFGRGMVHIVPLMVFVGTILCKKLFQNEVERS